MTLPMALTTGRLVLAPVFFLLFELAVHGPAGLLVGVVLVFAFIEVSDLLDGHAARALGLQTELGKVLDPFADSLSRLSYFVAFAGAGILPPWILLVLIYRDVTVAYIRVMVSRDGVLMPARLSGKVKAWVYAFAGIAGIVEFSLGKLGWAQEAMPLAQNAALAVFVLSAGVAIWSLIDYAVFFVKNLRRGS